MKGRKEEPSGKRISLWGNPRSSGFLAFVALFSGLSLSITGTDTGFEPSVFYTRGSVSLLKMEPHPSLYIPFDPLDPNWYPYLPFSPPPSTLLSKKVKSKAFLITLRTYSVVPALLLFQPCTWLCSRSPWVSVHLLICIMNWTVCEWSPTSPALGAKLSSSLWCSWHLWDGPVKGTRNP